MDSNAAELQTILGKSAERLTAGADSAALAFSGGLDSSILAVLLNGRCDLSFYVAGLEGCRDFDAAGKGAAALGLPLEKIVLNETGIRKALPEIIRITGTSEPLGVAISGPLYFVLKNCREKILFTGQGADELFGGYHRYLSMEKGELAASLEKDLETLLETGLGRERSLGAHFGKELRYPFLEKEVIGFARSIPLEMKIAGGTRKVALREAATGLGLPDFIVNSRKTAAQYGSGVMKVMEKAAKEKGMRLKDYLPSASIGSG